MMIGGQGPRARGMGAGEHEANYKDNGMVDKKPVSLPHAVPLHSWDRERIAA